MINITKVMNQDKNSPILEILESGIAKISLGSENEKVVILTEDRLNSFETLVDQLIENHPIGLIITGNSEYMFSAGADINVIQATSTQEEGYNLARRGQSIFDKISSLPFMTVAAISGPCVGGACELSLACDFRIISNNPRSSIGLPETKIGILPGFGGTQRLPRLIGLPEALKIILGGRVIKANQAKKIGLVYRVVNYDKLISEAENIILDAKPRPDTISFTDKLFTKIGIFRNIALKKALEATLKKTNNNYPAPIAALNAVKYGLEHGLEKGLENEAQELGRLIITPECKCLTNLFFLTESSKSIGKPAADHIKDLNSIVVGSGVMGAGIASELARIGSEVKLKDIKEEFVNKGLSHIKKVLSKNRSLNEDAQKEVYDRVQGVTQFAEAMNESNFAIEAIFENLELKKEVLADISEKLNDNAIIATNTSSLSVSSIAENIRVPERVIGMHFFNPVPRMPLVEIVRGSKTSDEVVCMVAAITTKMGKFPIVVKDVPGFLINRILTPYLNEAAFLLEEGYQIEDIDKAATDFGMPMGPIRLLDEVGLDVAAHVSSTLVEGYGKRMLAPNFVAQLLELGRKGKKNGLGFYNYVASKEIPDNTVYELLNITNKKESDLGYIQQRLILSLVNEAVLCLDEGVAGAPGKGSSSQIDLGTVMGIGFPPFRGGLIHYANSIGASKLVNSMQTLERQVGVRFRPVSGILSRAEKGIGFYE